MFFFQKDVFWVVKVLIAKADFETLRILDMGSEVVYKWRQAPGGKCQ